MRDRYGTLRHLRVHLLLLGAPWVRGPYTLFYGRPFTRAICGTPRLFLEGRLGKGLDLGVLFLGLFYPPTKFGGVKPQ